MIDTNDDLKMDTSDAVPEEQTAKATSFLNRDLSGGLRFIRALNLTRAEHLETLRRLDAWLWK